MICTDCGVELTEGSGFCRKCGAPVPRSLSARTDAELEALAAGGDREAFGELYDRHFHQVYEFVWRIVRYCTRSGGGRKARTAHTMWGSCGRYLRRMVNVVHSKPNVRKPTA